MDFNTHLENLKERDKEVYEQYLLVGLIGVMGAGFGISLTDVVFFKVVYDNLFMLAFVILVLMFKNIPESLKS